MLWIVVDGGSLMIRAHVCVCVCVCQSVKNEQILIIFGTQNPEGI